MTMQSYSVQVTDNVQAEAIPMAYERDYSENDINYYALLEVVGLAALRSTYRL